MSKSFESLSDKLRSLGVQTGLEKKLARPEKRLGIEDVVSGIFKNTSCGPVFCSELSTENTYTHGKVAFQAEPIHHELIHWADSSLSSSSLDLESILFLDTETTGLSGGTGTIPFMIGVGRFTGDIFTTYQIFLRNPGEERAQLELLYQFFRDIKSIATYNGKAFDAPILKTRFILNGLPSPFDGLAHFDLLPLSRRLWKRRLENRTLKDIETEILGFQRSQMEVPGWEVPLLYFDYLRTGDPTPMTGVFYHNAVDVQSLAALFLYINRMLTRLDTDREIPPVDILSLAIQYESTGQIDRAISLYERLLEIELSEKHNTELRLRYARIMKRNGDFSKATTILTSDEGGMDTQRIIQLAKVLEHQQQDIICALEWTELALSRLEKSNQVDTSILLYRQKMDLLKRRDRLKSKLGKMDD